MIRTPAAPPRALTPFVASLFVAGLLLLAPGAPAARAEQAAAADSLVKQQGASFEIYAGDHRLGTEKFRIYAIADTLIMTSEVLLDGAAPDSPLPLTKMAAFRQRAFDSYPVAFVAESHARQDTSLVERVLCSFRDTVVMITRDRGDRGRVESVGLPPGRLYLLEPGVYLQVQVLMADFLQGSQDKRKQSVLIPSLAQVIDVTLTRGPEEEIAVAGRKLQARKVEMTDGLTTFDGWLDPSGRLWRLTAVGQPLRVERVPEVPARATKAGRGAKGARKPGAPRSK